MMKQSPPAGRSLLHNQHMQQKEFAAAIPVGSTTHMHPRKKEGDRREK
jgi:hypothetical protein